MRARSWRTRSVAKGRDGRRAERLHRLRPGLHRPLAGRRRTSPAWSTRGPARRSIPARARPPTRRRIEASFAVIGGGPAGLEAARALASSAGRSSCTRPRRARRPVPLRPDGPRQGGLRGDDPLLRGRAGAARGGRSPGHEVGEDERSALAELDGVVLASGVLPPAVDMPGADSPGSSTTPALRVGPRRRAERSRSSGREASASTSPTSSPTSRAPQPISSIATGSPPPACGALSRE